MNHSNSTQIDVLSAASNVTPSLINRSRDALWIQFPAHILWVIFGLIGMWGSVCMIVVGYKWKPLHTISHGMVMGLVVGDLLISIWAVAYGIRKFVYTVRDGGEVTAILDCVPIALPGSALLAVKYTSALALSVDRCLAVMLPLKYRLFTRRYVFILIALVWLYAALRSITVILSRSLGQRAVILSACSVSSMLVAVGEHDGDASTRIGFRVTTIALYIAIAVCLNLKLRAAQQCQLCLREVKMTLQVRVTKNIAAIVFTIIVAGTVADVGISIVERYFPTRITALATVFASLFFVDAASTFFIFVFTHREFRTGFDRIILRRHNTVGASG